MQPGARLTLTLLLLAGMSCPVAAAPVVCTQNDRERNIEVVYSDPGQAVPCEVLYDKGVSGTQSTLWRASRESGYCEAKARSLVNKLSLLGWSCIDPQEAQEAQDAQEADEEDEPAPEG